MQISVKVMTQARKAITTSIPHFFISAPFTRLDSTLQTAMPSNVNTADCACGVKVEHKVGKVFLRR